MKRIVFALMIALIAVTGCLTDSTTDEDGGDNGGLNGSGLAEQYLPFVTGSRWNFTTTSVENGVTDTGSYAMVVSGTTVIDGKTYWVLEDSDSYHDNYSATTLRIDGDIVYQYDDMNYFNKNAAAKTAMAAALPVPQEIPMFDFSKSAGQSWSIFSGSYSFEEYGYSITMTGTYGGKESVTTPAGTFADCVKFTVTTTSVNSYQEQTFNGSSTMNIWFAKDVGPIKIVEQDAGDNYSQTKTDLLASYQAATSGGTGTYVVTGQIATSSGTGIAGVAVSLGGGSTNLTVTTDASGAYAFSGVGNGAYTLTPSKSGYTFTPATRQVTVGGQNAAVALFTGATQGGGGTVGGGAATYLPYKLNASWTYDTVEDYGDFTSTNIFTTTITGTTVLNGKTYWAMTNEYDSDGYTWSDMSYVRVEDDTYYAFLEDLYLGKKAAHKVSALMERAEELAGGELPFIKFGLSVGATWDIYTWQEGSDSFVITGKYLGTGSIQTTAGSFSNCAKFEVTDNIVSSFVDGDANVQIYRTDTTVNFWVAPNVGLVKMEESTTITDPGQDPFTYTTDDSLTGYSIP